jgi:hypothetical protein
MEANKSSYSRDQTSPLCRQAGETSGLHQYSESSQTMQFLTLWPFLHIEMLMN